MSPRECGRPAARPLVAGKPCRKRVERRHAGRISRLSQLRFTTIASGLGEGHRQDKKNGVKRFWAARWIIRRMMLITGGLRSFS
jgi:hypothetical protein